MVILSCVTVGAPICDGAAGILHTSEMKMHEGLNWVNIKVLRLVKLTIVITCHLKRKHARIFCSELIGPWKCIACEIQHCSFCWFAAHSHHVLILPLSTAGGQDSRLDWHILLVFLMCRFF